MTNHFYDISSNEDEIKAGNELLYNTFNNDVSNSYLALQDIAYICHALYAKASSNNDDFKIGSFSIDDPEMKLYYELWEFVDNKNANNISKERTNINN